MPYALHLYALHLVVRAERPSEVCYGGEEAPWVTPEVIYSPPLEMDGLGSPPAYPLGNDLVHRTILQIQSNS